MSSSGSGPVPVLEFPDSVEEAAALLGATITRCGKSTAHIEAALPPTGMHPAFAVTKAASELVSRLYILRAMLRTAKSRSNDLTAAPSIMQVLKKLLGVSTSLAAAANATVLASEPVVKPSKSSEQRLLVLKHKHETPPMLSTPCRQLWIDCVVLCFSFQSSDLTQFVRQMLALASVHPRSAKAAGGVRIAALSVVAALFEQLASQLAPWSLDVLQVCLKALRSAGNGEPTFREAAIRAACATATACRNAAWKNRKETAASMKDALLLQGAMEDRAVAESIRVLRQAVTDKFPEIRFVAANFAAGLAPMLVPLSGDPFASLDEVLLLAMKNLDDESPVVADGWAEALARCMSTAIQYNVSSVQAAGVRDPEAGGGSPVKTETSSSVRFGARKATGLAHSLDSVKKTIRYLVYKFVKSGGELAASRAGSAYSAGGRAVRLGYCLTLTRLLRLQSVMGSVGESRGISYREAILSILEMVGDDMDSLSAVGDNAANPLFGGGRSWSKTDAGLARLSTSRVLRHGISELAAESVQISVLQEQIMLLPNAGDAGQQSSAETPALNSNQIQVVLTEISHLLATLGEAAASKVEEIISRLKVCLSHENLGVRHEAAVACASLAAIFPSEGRKLIETSVDEIQQHHAQLVLVASANQNKVDVQGSGLRMFRRAPKEKMPLPDSALQHQFAIHGRALMVSILIKDLSQLPEGLPRSLLRTTLTAAETLISCQFNDILISTNAEVVCSCVRTGFCLISGVLTSGPDAVAPHVPLIVGAWQKAVKASKDGTKHLDLQHDLDCLEAVLCSMVAFLQFCSELLLAIPEALSQVTALLEDLFPLIQPNGRLSSVPNTPLVAARLESATASLLEAFAWLPSGSFPMVADEVFTFAADQIQKAVEEHVACSVLHSLVSKEDSILDSKSLSRAKREGQVGGARDIEESIICLTAEVSLYDERESVIHLQSHEPACLLDSSSGKFRGSSILELFASDIKFDKPPTPLHEVGTWRRPFDPSNSSKIRIIDAAIQAFSAIFGLKDGKEQQGAMDMLESLVPPLLTQLARTVGINAALTEQDWRSKGKEDSAAETNITAVLLSCLQALPLHEATHNVPISLGPPWMNKAKDLLLTLLPSGSTIIRRAAAEGLALLATLGVTEDAHFLQSTLLHSLDEVMQGNKPDGKPRALALEPFSAARAGSLLTLACIQRTAYHVSQRKCARARGRVSGSKTNEAIEESYDSLPVLQMMTRILPSAACHGFRDYFAVKTYALYSFAVLLLYSARLNNDPLGNEDKQLLRKAIELVEDNFSSSWTATSADINRGQEEEKMACEVAFLAVLLRLMTFLVPFLHNLVQEDRDIARRFSVMATVILESLGCHPVIFVESMAFFEVLSSHQQLLPFPSRNVVYSENPVFSCIPSIMAALTPARPTLFAQGILRPGCLMLSMQSLRAAVYTVRVLSNSHISVVEWTDMQVVSLLMASLESVCGSSHFGGGDLLRSVAANRKVKCFFFEGIALEREIFHTLPNLLSIERSFHAQASDRFFRWILFSKQLLSPSSGDDRTEGYTRSHVVAAATADAVLNASTVYKLTGQPRWQVKCLAAQIASEALREIICGDPGSSQELGQNIHLDFTVANKLCVKECAKASETGTKLPCSRLVFHLEDILAAACMSSVATMDHSELRLLQESSMHFLQKLIEAFGPISDPEESTTSILDQYATQIFSSIKHALAAPDHSGSASSSRLFVAGCKALHTVVAARITTDPVLLRRLLRPAVPSEGSLPIFSYADGSSVLKLGCGGDDTNLDKQESVVVRVGRLWTAGELLLGKTIEMDGDAAGLVGDLLGLAIHCAAAAIDGCRLLASANLTLVGRVRTIGSHESDSSLASGFHYQNEFDIDDSAKEILAHTWSTCSRCAVETLLNTVTSVNDESRRDLCFTWIKSLYPLFIAGICDGLAVIREHAQDGGFDWAGGIDASLVVVECLRGMGAVVSIDVEEMFDGAFNEQVEQLIGLLRESVLIPTLRNDNTMTYLFESHVVSEVCSFISHLAVCNKEPFSIDSSLLVTLLEPLNLLQTGQINFANTQADVIISACLAGVGSVFRQGSATDALVKAVLQLILNSIVAPNAELPSKILDAAKSLLGECLKQKCVSLKEQQLIACDLASTENWEGWSVISTLNDGKAIAKSLEVVQETLRSSDPAESQVAALAAIRSVAQKASGPVVGRLLRTVGADVVVVLYQYGTMKFPDLAPTHRTAGCADAMKIILIAYRQILAKDNDEQVSNFLSVIFETFLAVLRYNGLPNHPTHEPFGDPALGRICAQAVLHVARTSPMQSKKCMATLSEHDRTLLEFAVRAEMSGYAKAQQQAPAKKKLSLKGFQSI